MSPTPLPPDNNTPDSPARPARPGNAKPRPKSARRRSREYALQGLYQWLLARTAPEAIDAQMHEADDFGKCDYAHFDALLHGCIREAEPLNAALTPHLDRGVNELSPIEHAVLWIGAYELTHCLDVPYKVVINESVELAKSFGGTDGHKYVNGVLDKAAKILRATEVGAADQRR